MNLFQCKEFFSKMDKNAFIELDRKCVRNVRTTYTDGEANAMFHIDYNKAKVVLSGQEPYYVDIDMHTESCPVDEVKDLLSIF